MIPHCAWSLTYTKLHKVSLRSSRDIKAENYDFLVFRGVDLQGTRSAPMPYSVSGRDLAVTEGFPEQVGRIRGRGKSSTEYAKWCFEEEIQMTSIRSSFPFPLHFPAPTLVLRAAASPTFPLASPENLVSVKNASAQSPPLIRSMSPQFFLDRLAVVFPRGRH